MSNPLNGGVRSHASNPLPYPFNSSHALAQCGRDYCLTSLISAIASNDPRLVSACGDEADAVIRDAEAISRVVGNMLMRALDENDAEDVKSIVLDAMSLSYTGASLLQIAALAGPCIEDARLATKGGSHEK